MRRLLFSRSSLTLMLGLAFILGFFVVAENNNLNVVKADMTAQTLPFTQDWSNTDLITTNDDWSGVMGITGFRGDDLVAVTNADPREVLGDGSATPVEIIANQDNPSGLNSGGIAEFDTAPPAPLTGSFNPTIAMQGSGTSDVPHIVIYLNTTGQNGIRVQYNATDIDDQTNNDAIQQINTQFRVGGTGDYANVTGGYIADATTDGTNDVTAVDVTLPASADNQALVEVRIMTTNAGGSDEWIAIDDISITSGGKPPVTGDTDLDFDGDGTTDYAVIRDVSPVLRGTAGNLGRSVKQRLELSERNRTEQKSTATKTNNLGTPTPGNTVRWFINNSSDNSLTVTDFGDFANDTALTPSDFDGDGKDDLALWRQISNDQPSENAFYFILNSSDNTMQTVDFGITGDNPTMVGDYDGDGKSDPAVYRCDGPPFAQCTYFYKGSAGMGEITFLDWGNDVDADVKPNPGDFDGDGIFDFCVHQQAPGSSSQGQFILLRSSDGGIEYFNWGIRNTSSGDIIVPGDYDGDGQNDFMAVRVEGTAINWYLLEKDGGGTGNSPITFGIIPANANTSEFISQGDFDGDGATDIGIYRRDNVNPSNNQYFSINSSNQALNVFTFGTVGDISVTGWNAQ